MSLQNNPDATVVLRDAGRPPVLLATGGELSHDVGLPRRLAVSLAVYPSPSGASAAVTVRPAGGGPDGGMVILTRAGRMVAALLVRRGAGPDLGAPFWSPSAKSLAYLSTSRSGAAQLSIWAAGTADRVQQSPGLGRPLWLVRLGAGWHILLCAAAGGSEWVVARAAGGKPAVTPGPGLPVAWLR